MAHKPDDKTRAQVEAMAAYGIPHDDIGLVFGVTAKTLRKHYRKELDLGMTKANAQVAGALFKNATSGNVTAQIFWLKTRMGWKETVVGELDIPEGTTINIQVEPVGPK